MAITKAEILKAAETYNRKTASVPVPELGEGQTMRVRELSAAEYAPIGAMMMDAHIGRMGATERANVLAVVKGAIDDEGNRLFTDEDEKIVGELPIPVILRVSTAINRLSGIRKSVEEAAKN